MKRTILAALIAALTISIFATGVAFAQGRGPGGGGNGSSPVTQPAGRTLNTSLNVTLSTYMTPAMAEILGLTAADLGARLDAGETFNSIALSLGYTADQLPALMTSVRALAVDAAIAAGVITADQAALLPANQYSGTGTGVCDGTCVPQTTGGSMRRGGR
jgi:hypothetical protein